MTERFGEHEGLRRPEVGDRWQHRKTSRVCTVIEVHETSSGSWVFYRYESRMPNARSTRMQWVSVSNFTSAFAVFEAAC